MNTRDNQEPLIPPDALITNPVRALPRLRGSHSSQKPLAARPMLRRNNGDGGPINGDGDLPPPPPPVSVPDLALQFSPCLPDSLRDGAVMAVRQAIDPNADVRPLCLNQTERIGIWLQPAVNDDDKNARDRGMQKLSLLETGETLAFFINSSLIYSRAVDSWNNQPKRLDGDGVQNPDGPIHLTSFSLSFESPNRVVTRIGGFDERPWPDVDFTINITDTLSLSSGVVGCESETTLDTDTSWLNFLTGLFLLVLPPLGLVFLVERVIVGSADAPHAGQGAGCGAAALIPREILIPLGLKVVASYQRLNVSSGGIFTGGSFDVVERVPEVSISGPTQLSVSEGNASVVRTFGIQTQDLRPPLQIIWNGDGSALNQGAETTGIRFNLGSTEAGQLLTRRVSVRVTDADGLAGQADQLVSVFIVPGDDDNGFPPICKTKPWLPQCQAALARLRK